jgi:hypothetical protein
MLSLAEYNEYCGAMMKTVSMFLYRLILIVLLAWIAYTLQNEHVFPVRVVGGDVDANITESLDVNVTNEPLSIEGEVQIIR